MYRLNRLILASTMLSTLALSIPAFAQDNFPTYAYSDGHNVVVTQLDGSAKTISNFPKTPDDPITSITWSTDGKQLAFVANVLDASNNPETNLYMSDGKSQAVKLADHLDSAFPVFFTPDNQR